MGLLLKSRTPKPPPPRPPLQLNAQSLAEELASDQTVQYIRFLEVEQERLHGSLKELAGQLHVGKVANAALQRKLARPAATE